MENGSFPAPLASMTSTSKMTTFLLLAAVFPLASCGALRSAGRNSVAAVKNTTTAGIGKITSVSMPKVGLPDMPDFSLSKLLPNRGPKVVEVREKDLKELPTGVELAKAHEQERKNGFWFFGGPIDFKEPSLPEPGTELDGSLLPPLVPQ
jgi:hypothetical protein